MLSGLYAGLAGDMPGVHTQTFFVYIHRCRHGVSCHHPPPFSWSPLVAWFLDSATSCHVCSRVSDKSVCIVQSVCEQSACVNIVNVCAFE